MSSERALSRFLSDPVAAIRALDKIEAEGSLLSFVRLMWPTVEPNSKMANGWCLNTLCEHLEAVTAGQIRRLLINVPPGCMKEVHVDEPVLTHRGRIRLGDVVSGDKILTHRGRYRNVEAVHDKGQQQTLRIETFSGRRVVAELRHPFLTTRGWIEAQDLVAGDTLGAVIPLEEGFQNQITNEEARLLGYLVGDGGVTHSPTFTNTDEEILADFIRCAESAGFVARRAPHVPPSLIKKGAKFGRVGLRGARAWLKKHDLLGKNSYTKRIPSLVLASSREAIANFIGAYWSCDGTVAVRHKRARGDVHLARADTVSEWLARDLQHALLRLGISSRVRAKTAKLTSKKQPGGVYRSWCVLSRSHNETVKFKNMPGLCSRKNAPLLGLVEQTFVQGPLVEDEIVSIQAIGLGECRCLTVEEDHSFTAGDLAVHNSLLLNCFWPAWEWGPKNRPSLRYLCASYSDTLTLRDNARCRSIVVSPEYQSMWGNRFGISEDNNSKTCFGTNKTGFKMATSVGGVGTGARADRILVDDPHSVLQAESEKIRESTLQWFTEVMPTRVSNDSSAIVVIMQRVHERDVSGLILAGELGYEHLCLPMEFEKDHPFKSQTSLNFVDPRTEEGELLWPERFSRESLEKDTKPAMRAWGGTYSEAGQLQQRPSPRGGGMFKRANFQFVDAVPPGARRVRGWDLAATEGGGAWTVGARLAKTPDGRVFVDDIVRIQGSSGKVETLIRETARKDGPTVLQDIPQDPGQAGKAQVNHLRQKLDGFKCFFTPETGSKEDRAQPLASISELGNLYLLRAPWNEKFIKEAEQFPAGATKDQVDASSRAYARLIRKREIMVGGAPELIQ